jgi:hypothetical protein
VLDATTCSLVAIDAAWPPADVMVATPPRRVMKEVWSVVTSTR